MKGQWSALEKQTASTGEEPVPNITFSIPAFNESEIQTRVWESDFLRLFCLCVEWRIAFIFFSPFRGLVDLQEFPEEAGGLPAHRNQDVTKAVCSRWVAGEISCT